MPAASVWSPGLHPRDRNGRFIEKFDLVRLLSAGGGTTVVGRGRVVGNTKGPGGHDYLMVQLDSDGPMGGPSEVIRIAARRTESAPDPKARLTPTTYVEKAAGPDVETPLPPGEPIPGTHYEGIDKYTEAMTYCAKGHKHWGTMGAAGMLIRHTDELGVTRYLIQQRSPYVQLGGTWSVPGGAITPDHPDPLSTGITEATEELGSIPEMLTTRTVTVDHGGWGYTTVIADVPEMFEPGGQGSTAWEQSAVGWFTRDELKDLPLHPGFESTLPVIDRSETAPIVASVYSKLVDAIKSAVPHWDPSKHPRDRLGRWIEVGDLMHAYSGPGVATPESTGKVAASHFDVPTGRMFIGLDVGGGKLKWYRPKQLENVKAKATLKPDLPLPALDAMDDEVHWNDSLVPEADAQTLGNATTAKPLKLKDLPDSIKVELGLENAAVPVIAPQESDVIIPAGKTPDDILRLIETSFNNKYDKGTADYEGGAAGFHTAMEYVLAETDFDLASAALSKLMTAAKLGGKQRKRYNAVLVKKHGGVSQAMSVAPADSDPSGEPSIQTEAGDDFGFLPDSSPTIEYLDNVGAVPKWPMASESIVEDFVLESVTDIDAVWLAAKNEGGSYDQSTQQSAKQALTDLYLSLVGGTWHDDTGALEWGIPPTIDKADLEALGVPKDTLPDIPLEGGPFKEEYAGYVFPDADPGMAQQIEGFINVDPSTTSNYVLTAINDNEVWSPVEVQSTKQALLNAYVGSKGTKVTLEQLAEADAMPPIGDVGDAVIEGSWSPIWEEVGGQWKASNSFGSEAAIWPNSIGTFAMSVDYTGGGSDAGTFPTVEDAQAEAAGLLASDLEVNSQGGAPADTGEDWDAMLDEFVADPVPQSTPDLTQKFQAMIAQNGNISTPMNVAMNESGSFDQDMMSSAMQALKTAYAIHKGQVVTASDLSDAGVPGFVPTYETTDDGSDEGVPATAAQLSADELLANLVWETPKAAAPAKQFPPGVNVGTWDDIYEHPQGSVIVVGYGGQVTKYDQSGKKKPTSATSEKLQGGHGQWQFVGSGQSGVQAYNEKHGAPKVTAKKVAAKKVAAKKVAAKKTATGFMPAPAPTPPEPQVSQAQKDQAKTVLGLLVTTMKNKGVWDKGAVDFYYDMWDKDHEDAQKDLAALMTRAKLGGKQRKRYKDALSTYFGIPVEAGPTPKLQSGSGGSGGGPSSWASVVPSPTTPSPIANVIGATKGNALVSPGVSPQQAKGTIQNQLAARMKGKVTRQQLADSVLKTGFNHTAKMEQLARAVRDGVVPKGYGLTKGANGNYELNQLATIKPTTVAQLEDALRSNIANQLVANWASTSNDSNVRSLALQRAAIDEFGLTDTYDWHQKVAGEDLEYERNGALYRAFLRAMYENTQEWAKTNKVKHVRLRRGSAVYAGPVGSTVKVKLRPMSSFSTNKATANGFGSNRIDAIVPVEWIIGTAATGFGCQSEYEWVVLGGIHEVRVVQ